ncbi:MAG: 3-hydroxybutyrate dehydrogenase [Alphaproteobacteria bacterium]|nr:3-hydroxybutyrate dehydrogenase [Alphaproteobacteria bacterium]MBV8548574.1 3-hydroxybutyrate dehydrogenase [Alphaproteobacteria bacterium]
MANLQGKTAIVTGSTSGIGQGIAEALAKSGANIMLNGLGDAAKIEAQRVAFEKNYNVRAAYHPADMTKPAEIADMVNTAAAKFGSVDILVNNAGIQHVSPIDQFPIDKWDAIIAINLSASFHAIRAVVPHMREKGWGRIIQIASAHALVASPFKSAYVAAKHGIAGLTKTVALEVAENKITCNAICPGYVWTPLVAGQIADTAKARNMSEDEVKAKVILAAQPTRQFTTVEQLGELAVFLCGSAADNITGAMLPVDGGWTAQ